MPDYFISENTKIVLNMKYGHSTLWTYNKYYRENERYNNDLLVIIDIHLISIEA